MITFCYKYAERYISLLRRSLFLSQGRLGRGKKQKRAGDNEMVKGFLSSHRPHHAYYYFYWDTHGSLCGGDCQYIEQYSTDTMELPYD